MLPWTCIAASPSALILYHERHNELYDLLLLLHQEYLEIYQGVARPIQIVVLLFVWRIHKLQEPYPKERSPVVEQQLKR